MKDYGWKESLLQSYSPCLKKKEQNRNLALKYDWIPERMEGQENISVTTYNKGMTFIKVVTKYIIVSHE